MPQATPDPLPNSFAPPFLIPGYSPGFILIWHFRKRLLKVKVNSICTINPETSKPRIKLYHMFLIMWVVKHKLTTRRFGKFGFHKWCYGYKYS